MTTAARLALIVAPILLLTSCALVFLGTNPSTEKLKKAAGGYWEVMPPEESLLQSWFAIDPNVPGTSVRIQWSFGLGCTNSEGAIVGNQIHAPTMEAIFVIENSRNATIRFDDGTVR